MELGLPDKHKGKFFTPYPVAQLMAQLVFKGFRLKDGYETVNDPACGAGGLLIA